MTRKGAIQAMVIITAAFPQDIPEATLELYVASLEDIPDEAVMEACRKIVLSSRFLPRIAEIREQAVRIADPHLLPPTEAQAWSEVQRAIETGGRHGQVVWSHPAISEAIKGMGGFRQVCDSTADTNRFRWAKVYRDIHQTKTREVLESNIKVVRGIGGTQAAKEITDSAQAHTA